MKKLFVGGLPPTTTESSLTSLFTQYGKVHSIKLVKDIFSGKCKGFGFLEMEGHEARVAIAELDGKTFEGKMINVKFEQAKNNRHR
jgi:RNA recognition motif-containing protein